jgi:hypothetical protein
VRRRRNVLPTCADAVQGRRRLLLDASWDGRGIALEGVCVTPGGDVNSMHVDEEDRIIITTHAAGGLKITDVRTDQLLWSLPEVSTSDRPS